MGTASLLLGIVALIVAALATAPFFGLLAAVGAPAPVLAIAFGVAQLLKSAHARATGRDVPRDELGYAWRGLGLGVLSAVWMTIMLASKGGM